ncbi:MAG TPA: class I SAM-dependent methyltransferase [Planctomycetes bacterium]|jgi:ubiquinone/menaquinone biosynthesis C-methylase UbiE|nr:class I SAM-dependent methyltransferase [Planctomycetota bacterium]HIK83322.1 class I SAM-dependent methyltransferase [Planctomycetota bacterium]
MEMSLMTTTNPIQFPQGGIHHFVSKYIQNMPDLTGKVVLDIPCGDGRGSHEFAKKGAEIIALDLFPHFMKLPDVEAKYADLMEPLPLEDGAVDFIICQEGIEHVPDQLGVLEEFNRVLRKDGALLLTTPNFSHMRARLSRFMLESDYWKRMPPTEIDSIWFAQEDSDKFYFGHLFLRGAQHYETLLTISGFQTAERVRTDIGNASLFLAILMYPLLLIYSLLSWLYYRRKNKQVDQATRDRILWDRVALNLSMKTLVCKHLFWVMRKEYELPEVAKKLRKLQKDISGN